MKKLLLLQEELLLTNSQDFQRTLLYYIGLLFDQKISTHYHTTSFTAKLWASFMHYNNTSHGPTEWGWQQIDRTPSNRQLEHIRATESGQVLRSSVQLDRIILDIHIGLCKHNTSNLVGLFIFPSLGFLENHCLP